MKKIFFVLVIFTIALFVHPTYAENEETQRDPREYVKGTVVGIDKKAFTMMFVDPSRVYFSGSGEFNYEILTVEISEKTGDSPKEIKKFILPHPSSYLVGDQINVAYSPLKKEIISFLEIFKKAMAFCESYTGRMVIQPGWMDGITGIIE